MIGLIVQIFMTKWDGRLLLDIMPDIRHIKQSYMQYLLFHQVISG